MRRFLSLTLALGLLAGPALSNPWDLIQQIGYKETEANGRWRVEKTIPPELRAMAPDFRITGYYVPVQAQARVTQFLLVPDPADCPFCGESGYGPTLEVTARRAMPDMPEGTRITLKGRLAIDDSDTTYRAVMLENAVLVD
ncbi:hypothetical protein [Pseudoponticoccus marisrubri]|uniref:DUF3299 domain-containing protein n=1 Tax=Pseudoponticoccus marisrubri TaxID=1685382 RepID=A0A0W7WMI5_9RHOB|nr:hypothetical protein [Pseudoponticoccus marisrubri]KUF11782.1 hypothetical protein AVJ23_04140 [Pseudoponticoccus marisrubri]